MHLIPNLISMNVQQSELNETLARREGQEFGEQGASVRRGKEIHMSWAADLPMLVSPPSPELLASFPIHAHYRML